MPVTKSAKRALRVSRRRARQNVSTRTQYKHAVKDARAKKTPTTVSAAYHTLDAAAKKGIIHWKKAARLKSRLAQLLVAPGKKKSEAKKTTLKAATKKEAATV
ncbi:MAG: 30S ribosomal protein S20 [Patescibacteria group bacterium]|mgnify:CR=1 FL=1